MEGIEWLHVDDQRRCSILAINDPQTVTVVMGSDFTGGIIQAIASGVYDQQYRLICNDRIVIKPLP